MYKNNLSWTHQADAELQSGIRTRIEARRVLLAEQEKCETQYIDLHAAALATKQTTPGLAEKIASADQDVQEYIKRLEKLNNNTWCERCAAPKQVGSADPAPAASLDTDRETKYRLVLSLYNDLEHQFASIRTVMDTLLPEVDSAAHTPPATEAVDTTPPFFPPIKKEDMPAPPVYDFDAGTYSLTSAESLLL